MPVIKIDLDRPVQEFEIGGQVFELSYDDDSLRQYQKVANKFFEDTQKAQAVALADMTPEQQAQVEQQYTEIVRDCLDALFGAGAYGRVYEAAGRSSLNVAKVVEVVYDWINKNLGRVKTKQRNYYTK